MNRLPLWTHFNEIGFKLAVQFSMQWCKSVLAHCSGHCLKYNYMMIIVKMIGLKSIIRIQSREDDSRISSRKVWVCESLWMTCRVSEVGDRPVGILSVPGRHWRWTDVKVTHTSHHITVITTKPPLLEEALLYIFPYKSWFCWIINEWVNESYMLIWILQQWLLKSVPFECSSSAYSLNISSHDWH